MEAPPTEGVLTINTKPQPPQPPTSTIPSTRMDLNNQNKDSIYPKKSSERNNMEINSNNYNNYNNNYYNNYNNYNNNYNNYNTNNQINVNVQSNNVKISSSSEEEDIGLAIHLSIRSKFMLKVFGILIFQLIITFAFILIAQIEKVKTYLVNNNSLFLILLCVSLFIYITAFIIFICSPSLTRKVPINYIILILITISFTIILTFLSCFYSFEVVLSAISYLIAICVAIFAIALFNKIDIQYLVMFIITLFFLLLAYGLLALIFRNYYLLFLYCIFVAVLYALFIVFDTIAIRDHFSIDDYIFAALTLYFDIIRLFILLLKILGSSKN